jgi:DNA polymerase-3 subunit gamma/tau
MEVSDNVKNEYLNQSKAIADDMLIRLLTLFTKSESEYKSSNNKRLHVEVALMQACYLKRARVRQS